MLAWQRRTPRVFGLTPKEWNRKWAGWRGYSCAPLKGLFVPTSRQTEIPKRDGTDSLPSYWIVDGRDVGSLKYWSTSLLHVARRITQPAVGSSLHFSFLQYKGLHNLHSHGRLKFGEGVHVDSFGKEVRKSCRGNEKEDDRETTCPLVTIVPPITQAKERKTESKVGRRRGGTHLSGRRRYGDTEMTMTETAGRCRAWNVGFLPGGWRWQREPNEPNPRVLRCSQSCSARMGFRDKRQPTQQVLNNGQDWPKSERKLNSPDSSLITLCFSILTLPDYRGRRSDHLQLQLAPSPRFAE